MPQSSSLRGMGEKKALEPRPAPKPINQRSAEYQAEKLTGNRAVQGKLPTGGPRYVYEMKWAGINPATKKPWPCSFEPAGCLIGWEAQMKAGGARRLRVRYASMHAAGGRPGLRLTVAHECYDLLPPALVLVRPTEAHGNWAESRRGASLGGGVARPREREH